MLQLGVRSDQRVMRLGDVVLKPHKVREEVLLVPQVIPQDLGDKQRSALLDDRLEFTEGPSRRNERWLAKHAVGVDVMTLEIITQFDVAWVFVQKRFPGRASSQTDGRPDSINHFSADNASVLQGSSPCSSLRWCRSNP
jgi:hypothetical protein